MFVCVCVCNMQKKSIAVYDHGDIKYYAHICIYFNENNESSFKIHKL